MSSFSVQKKATSIAPMELHWFRPAVDLSTGYVDTKCEPKRGVLSAGDEALEIKADGHRLGAAGAGQWDTP